MATGGRPKTAGARPSEFHWDGKEITGKINPGRRIALPKVTLDAPTGWCTSKPRKRCSGGAPELRYVIDGKLREHRLVSARLERNVDRGRGQRHVQGSGETEDRVSGNLVIGTLLRIADNRAQLPDSISITREDRMARDRQPVQMLLLFSWQMYSVELASRVPA